MRGHAAASNLLKKREVDDAQVLGGLAQVYKCLPQVPGLEKIGKRVYAAASSSLRTNEGSIDECLTNLGCEQGAGPTDTLLLKSRKMLGDVLGVTDFEPPASLAPGPGTPVLASLLIKWAQDTEDPDVAAARWFVEGAPGGLDTELIPSGVFPPLLRPDELVGIDNLQFADEESGSGFVNYEGIENEPEVADELQKHLNLRRLAQFDDYSGLLRFLRNKRPDLNKLGFVIPFKGGIRKLRLILDAKSSEVYRAAVRSERIMIPRVLDAVNDVLAHLAFNHHEERAGRRSWADAEGGWHPGVELLVIDIE